MSYKKDDKFIVTRHQLNMLLHDCAGYLGGAQGWCHRISQDITDTDNPTRIEKVVSRLRDINQRLDKFYETIKTQPLTQDEKIT